MSDNTRRLVYDRQKGLCEYCDRPLNGNYILHHLKNRSQNGATTPSNLVGRHPNCEIIAHKLYKFGNPNGQYRVHSKEIVVSAKTTRNVRRSDRRNLNLNLAKIDEEYAFRMYCQGRIA